MLPEVRDSEIACIAPRRQDVPVPTGALIYGHMPLMLTPGLPLAERPDCAHCDRQGVLTDRKARKFPVRCTGGVRTIYNPVAPLYGGQARGPGGGLRGGLLHPGKAGRRPPGCWPGSSGERPFDGEFTRGLYIKVRREPFRARGAPAGGPFE